MPSIVLARILLGHFSENSPPLKSDQISAASPSLSYHPGLLSVKMLLSHFS